MNSKNRHGKKKMKLADIKLKFLLRGTRLNVLLMIVVLASLAAACLFFMRTTFEREIASAQEKTFLLVSTLRNDVESEYARFADEMRYKISYAPLSALLADEAPAYDKILPLRKLYSLDQDIISKIWVLSPDGKGRAITCEKNNYFNLSEIAEYAPSPFVSDGKMTEALEFPCYAVGGDLAYRVIVELDYGKLVGKEMSMLSSINPDAWFFYMKPAGRPVEVRKSGSSNASIAIDSTARVRIFSEVSAGYDGSTENKAFTGGREIDLVSSYSPLGKNAEKGWIMVSLDKQKVLSSIVSAIFNVSIIFIALLSIIVAVSSYFIFRIRSSGKALWESQRKWSFAIEGSGEGVWEWDAATRKIHLSGRSREILSAASDEIEEWTLNAHHDDEKRVKDAISTCMSGDEGLYNCEYRFKCSDGSFKWILDRGMILERDQGTPLRMIGTVADISSRKKSEEEIRRLSERLDLAIRAAGIGVWDWDMEKNRLIWDDWTRKLYGIESEDFPTKIEDWFEMIDPADRKRVKADIESSKTRRLYFSDEFRIVARDGTKKFVRSEAKVFLNEIGIPSRIVGVSYDITKSKTTENELVHNSETASLIARMSTHFINIDSPSINNAITLSLGSLCAHLRIDVVRIFRFSEDDSSFTCTNEWNSMGASHSIPRKTLQAKNESHWMRTLREYKNIFVKDFMKSAPPDAKDWSFLEGVPAKSALLLPLAWRNRLEGFICFMTVSHEWSPGDAELSLLQTLEDIFLSSFKREEIEVALIKNQEKLRESNTELNSWKSRISNELSLAGALQKKIFRPDPRISDESCFMWAHKPAMDVGGDIFGIESLKNGRVCLFVGDVSGHGVGSALVSFMMKAIVKEAIDDYSDLGPAKICNEINRRYLDSVSSDFYVTFFIGIFNPADFSWNCMNCGHPEPLIFTDSGKFLDFDLSSSGGGLPIGMGFFGKNQYSETDEFRFLTPPGYSLLLYTDGIVESENTASGEMCDIETLKEVAGNVLSSKMLGDPASEIVAQVSARGFNFDRDDMTVMSAVFHDPASISMKKEIKPSLDAIQSFSDELDTYLSSIGWKEESAYAAHLLCAEHLSNVVKHGLISSGAPILFMMRICDSGTAILFSDHGCEWNCEARKESEEPRLAEGGYGLGIIRKLSDVSVFYRKDGINHAYFVISKDACPSFDGE